jgi:hypothetical protein
MSPLDWILCIVIGIGFGLFSGLALATPNKER